MFVFILKTIQYRHELNSQQDATPAELVKDRVHRLFNAYADVNTDLIHKGDFLAVGISIILFMF